MDFLSFAALSGATVAFVAVMLVTRECHSTDTVRRLAIASLVAAVVIAFLPPPPAAVDLIANVSVRAVTWLSAR